MERQSTWTEINEWTRRQRALAEAAVRISSSLSVARPVESILKVICDAAAEIVGAHLATVGMTVDRNWAHSVQAVTLSDKYAAWRGYDDHPNGTGIYSLVCNTNRPIRLTHEELTRHPSFRGYGHAAEKLPPLRGLLCVPLIGKDGRNLGALHLSDKVTGEFTVQDEAIAIQLASMAAVAVENHVLFEAVEKADRVKADLLVSLRESEEKFRTLANSIPQLTWMADPSGWIFWYNERWFNYTGGTLDEMQGWGWQKAHHPDHVIRVVERIRQCFANGEIWEDTFPLLGRDGAYRWFLSRAIPIRDEDGKISRWFGTNTDVTEQLQTEAALRAADSRKDEFLATLAHELRNPLASIHNSLEVLRRFGQGEPQLQRNNDIIDRQLRQMTRLTDDLLDLARVGRGKLVLRKEMADLLSIVRSAAETAASVIEERGHTLTISVPREPLLVEVDPGRLEQVVINLLTNAAKYTEPGGKIWLVVERNGNEAMIRVRDTGIGMTADFASHAFEMFAQAEPGKERTRGGLGIGLPLVRALVEIHGGTVTACSDGLGCGTELIVRLPGAVEPRIDSEKSKESRVEARVGGRARRILIVDDYKDSAQSMATFLRLIGNDVHTSYDGPSALEAAAEYQPEVVLLDIGLPGVSGYEVARSIRKLSGLANVILIAITGWSREEDRRRCSEAGFNHHLVKPIDFGLLQQVLERPDAAQIT
jgi:PAS domain S-box-containing protein